MEYCALILPNLGANIETVHTVISPMPLRYLGTSFTDVLNGVSLVGQPHYPETYYVVSKNVKESDFV